MNYSLALMLASFAMLVSFLVLTTAFNGESLLRIVLAAVGFLGFGGLFVAVLAARKRTTSA